MRGLRLPAPLRGIASILSGSVAGQGVVILSYPLLTRLYEPAEFGLLTVFTSTVTLLAVLSTAALDGAIPLPVEDRDAAAVAWAALTFVVTTSLATVVVWVLAADSIAALLGVPQLAHYAWLAGLTVLGLGIYEVFTDWMVRRRSYGALGRRNLLQGIGQVVSQIGLGLAGVRPLGLLVGPAAGRFASLGGVVSRDGLLRQPRPTLAAMRSSISRFRAFPLLALPSSFVNKAGLEVPLLLTSAIYGDARAGLLGLTVRVISGPLGTIGQAVYQVFAGESSASVRDSRGTLGAEVRGAARRLVLVGLVPAVALIGFGPDLFALVFGPQWAEAGSYARVLAVAYLAQFAVVPISATLFLLERQGQELAWATGRLLLTTGGPAICGWMGAPITVAIATLGLGQLISYIVLYRLCVNAADVADGRYRHRAS